MRGDGRPSAPTRVGERSAIRPTVCIAALWLSGLGGSRKASCPTIELLDDLDWDFRRRHSSLSGSTNSRADPKRSNPLKKSLAD